MDLNDRQRATWLGRWLRAPSDPSSGGANLTASRQVGRGLVGGKPVATSQLITEAPWALGGEGQFLEYETADGGGSGVLHMACHRLLWGMPAPEFLGLSAPWAWAPGSQGLVPHLDRGRCPELPSGDLAQGCAGWWAVGKGW